MSKALYVLAGYDDNTEAYLAGIQNKLYEAGFTGTQTKNIPMHITMGSFPCEKEEEMIEMMKKLSEEVAGFDITFNHIGMFGGGNVLFIAPDTNRELLDLKELFGTSYNWAAHTTMLIDSADVIGKALPVVIDNFKAFAGRVEKLHLYEFFPTRHIISVNLK